MDITCVAGQLAAYSDVAFARFQVVNGTNVIETTAGHVVSGRGVRAGHDPRGTQRDGMDLAKNTGEKIITQACGTKLR